MQLRFRILCFISCISCETCANWSPGNSLQPGYVYASPISVEHLTVRASHFRSQGLPPHLSRRQIFLRYQTEEEKKVTSHVPCFPWLWMMNKVTCVEFVMWWWVFLRDRQCRPWATAVDRLKAQTEGFSIITQWKVSQSLNLRNFAINKHGFWLN